MPSRFLHGLIDQKLSQSAGASANPRGSRRGKTRQVAACRVCTRPLTEARECKLGRCVDCPSTYDEGLYDALRQWRKDKAAEEKVPAYCVFTDATMTALAEIRPRDAAGLVRVPGIGQAKLIKYGDDLVSLCAAEPSA
ncbi:MAG: HRDC domain-containing protein [Nocardioidaceae bacterium]